MSLVSGITALAAAIATAINTKAPKASPTFTGTVTVPTPSATGAAVTKAYADTKLASSNTTVADVIVVTAAAYAALSPKVSTTLYVIVG
jgi:hypothetical protein